MFEEDIVVFNGEYPIMSDEVITLEPGTVITIRTNDEVEAEKEPFPTTYCSKLSVK